MGGGYKNKVTSQEKKTLKAVILTAIITAILTGTIGVVAVSLSAKEIPFISTDEEWQVTNVEDAINELYVLGKNASKVIDLGTSGTIDVSSYEGYEDFTVDNFLVTLVSYSASTSTVNGYQSGGGTAKITKTYDPTTGILKVSNTSKNYGMGSGTVYSSVAINTYLVI